MNVLDEIDAAVKAHAARRQRLAQAQAEVAEQRFTDEIPDVVRVTVNGERYERTVESRVSLADFLRHELGLTGTHIGCEHGVCGACTVLVDGDMISACITPALFVDGTSVQTIEGLAPEAVIVGGPIVRSWPVISEEIKGAVESTICRGLPSTRIIASTLGPEPTLMGAMSLVLASKFASVSVT